MMIFLILGICCLLDLAGSIMDNFDFTEEEIEEQLALLGYRNIPKHRLSAFKKGQFYLPHSFLSACLFTITHSGPRVLNTETVPVMLTASCHYKRCSRDVIEM